ncbi:hypothetical protein V6Z11_A10G288700 [Gossypium hirsutum]
MEIYKCSSLKYIFTPSMLFSLKQLEQIEVKECNTMEQVIREDEEGATIHTLTLPKLSFVKIERCSNLTNFYLGSQPLEIPNLWVITIAECPKMTAFSSTISRKSEKVIEERDVEDNITVLFCDKVVIPHLENLKLSSINIQKIWHHPSYSPERNQMFSTLRSLCLEDLPKLKDTCFENSFEFPCLRDLTLKNCPLLKTFISKSVCEDKPQIHQPTQTNNSAVLNEKVVFPRLEKLLIQGCDSLEEIIELQALNASEAQSTSATRSTMAETMMTKFVFPRLTHLGLDKVPSLKSFYSRMHTTQWPSLKFMKVIECPRAQIFCEVEIPNQQPLFCVNEVCSLIVYIPCSLLEFISNSNEVPYKLPFELTQI